MGIALGPNDTHLDMRIIRTSSGRGMGDAFYEQSYEVFQEPSQEGDVIKVSSVVQALHYEESPEVRRTVHRPSDFRGYRKLVKYV